MQKFQEIIHNLRVPQISMKEVLHLIKIPVTINILAVKQISQPMEHLIIM